MLIISEWAAKVGRLEVVEGEWAAKVGRLEVVEGDDL
jgi:hypothetical protein